MKLRKSRENVVFSGVLGGIGESFNIDPTIVRIVFVLLLFSSSFPLIPLYIIGTILIPKADPKNDQQPIDKSSIDKHNGSKIKEDDWSDF